jgi:hypothetical protein
MVIKNGITKNIHPKIEFYWRPGVVRLMHGRGNCRKWEEAYIEIPQVP